MDKQERDSGIVISDKLLYLCKCNQQNKVYDVENGIYKDLLHDMYEGKYKVFDYPADCDKAYERVKTQRRIAQHINGKKASIAWIKNYCKFFGCSADYMLGLIDSPTKELTDIHNRTGLSDHAIKGLLALKDSDNISVENFNPNHQLTPILNQLLAMDNGLVFEHVMTCIREYLLSGYTIPFTHTKKGKPIIPDSEYDYSYNPITKSKQYYLSLLRNENDFNDCVSYQITKENIQTTAMKKLEKCLSRIEEDFKNL